MKSKKQQMKKKARELKGKARAATRRHKLELMKKEERRGAKLNAKFREKIVPFVKDPEKKKIQEEIEHQKSLKKLERNMQILKALEDEYMKETEARKNLNQKLEAEGHLTMQEKLNALEKSARESMGEEQVSAGGIDLTAEKQPSEEI